MSQPKLLQVLSVLDKEEWAGFKKYLLMHTRVESDNYNLYLKLQKNQKKFDQYESVQKLRRAFFPHMSDKVCANMLSRVMLWLEEYLILSVQLEQSWASDLALVKIYNGRGLFKQADQKANALEKEIAKSKGHDSAKAKTLAALYHAQYFSDNPIKYRSGTELLTQLVENYQDGHKEQGLLYLMELHNWGILKNYDYSVLEKSLQQSLEVLPSSPLAAELNRLNEMICKEDPVLFELIKKALFEGKFKKGTEVHTIVTLYLIVFGGRMHTKSILPSGDIVMELYNFALEEGVLMISGKLPVKRFHNIVSILGLSQKQEIMNDFIHRWYKEVATKFPESIKNIALAQSCFLTGRYEEILALTRSLEFEDISQKTRTYGLESIALYMCRKNDYDGFENHLQNFTRLLNRNKLKLSKAHYSQNINLIKLLGLLAQRDFKEVEINLEDFNVLLYRAWFKKHLKEKGGN